MLGFGQALSVGFIVTVIIFLLFFVFFALSAIGWNMLEHFFPHISVVSVPGQMLVGFFTFLLMAGVMIGLLYGLGIAFQHTSLATFLLRGK